jgi:hypothetical protein
MCCATNLYRQYCMFHIYICTCPTVMHALFRIGHTSQSQPADENGMIKYITNHAGLFWFLEWSICMQDC